MGFWTQVSINSNVVDLKNKQKETNKLLKEQNRLLHMTPEQIAAEQQIQEEKKSRNASIGWILLAIIIVIAFPWLLLIIIPFVVYAIIKHNKNKKGEKDGKQER